MTNPDLDPSWPLGLDVSYCQGTVDWSSVARQGFKFAFIKATEGTSLTDSQFGPNWSGAKAAGLIRGAYHFYDPGKDPRQQAEHFLSIVWPDGQPLFAPGDLPPVLDIETAGDQSAEEVVQGIQAWLSRVGQKTARVPILYTDRGFWDDLGTTQLGNHPLWVAETGVAAPSSLPAGWQTWLFWQFSQSGSMEGISGAVDLDVFQGSLQSLQQMASSPSTPGL